MSEQDSELTLDMVLKMGELAEKTPKIPDLVLFLGRSGGSLIDNVKHLFLETVRHRYRFKNIFYTDMLQAATELTMYNTPVLTEFDFDLFSRAAWVVCDDFHWRNTLLEYMTKGARIFQLWHGIPLKSIGLIQAATEHQNMPPQRKEWIRFGYSGYDAVLSPSEYVSREIFSQVFGTKQFVNFGYPRTDVFLRPGRNLDKFDMINVPADILGQMQRMRKSGGRVIAYMPTFRDYNAQGEMKHAPNAGRYLDIEALGEFGQRYNVLFMLKYHPYIKDVPRRLPEHCLFCPHNADVYPLLRFTDALLTDYSSIYFDYLLLNRPIHYFTPDKEEYELKDRKFMLNFDDWTPGAKSRTQEECLAALEELLANNMDDGFEAERLRMRDILFDHLDDQAAVRCCRFLEECIHG